MRFFGKNVLITGAAVGIGRAAAIKFAAEGARVAAIDMNADALLALKEEISKSGGDASIAVCDVTDEAAVTSAIAEFKGNIGKIDILVNNAALWRDKLPFLDISTEMWKRYFDVNIMGVVYCTRAVLPDMLEAQYGRIINIASVAGVYGVANLVHYSSTKGALIAMTKALAKEVSDKGVLVNAVSPGSVSPSSVADYDYVKPSDLSFMGRTGSDMENANLICFLASDEASYIAGQNIQIDGCRKKL